MRYIMTIFNKFAGFSLGEADIIRRYMSKKKTEKFMAYKEKFVEGMISRGGSAEKVETFWEQLVEFSKYAFNCSHAAAYAFVSYYTAWLKCYYPKEYLCAVMNDTVFDKIGGLIGDCKTFGINVLPPDVNSSEEGFSVKDDAIVCGLGGIKNVGSSAEAIIAERRLNGEYISFADFLLRTRTKKDAIESLIAAGAMDSFSRNRNSLTMALPQFLKVIDKIKIKEKAIKEVIDEKKIEKLNSTLSDLIKTLNSITFDVDDTEDQSEKLHKEKELLGAYISAHPLDSYSKPADNNCNNIANLSSGKNLSIMGLISNLRIANRKSDGKPMAFFTLEDTTGSIEICTFTKAYEANADYIKEDAVVKITGNCDEEIDNFTDESVLSFKAQSFENLMPIRSLITLYVNSIPEWFEIEEDIKPYLDKNGATLRVYDKLTGIFRKTNYFISKEILSDKRFNTSM